MASADRLILDGWRRGSDIHPMLVRVATGAALSTLLEMVKTRKTVPHEAHARPGGML